MNLINIEKKLGIVSASWHIELLDRAKEACISELAARDVDVENAVKTYVVPGSLEIPLVAQKLAQTGEFAAIIALGLIVDGGIYRHEFVANAVISNLVRVQLDTGVPVFSCVLTPHHFHEHQDHQAFFAEHLVTKGREVARACLAQLQVLSEIDL
jgi:6,7-dimethyl-8-ribityllumazine synthase